MKLTPKAIHEAAHAVVCVNRGRKFGAVTIDPKTAQAELSPHASGALIGPNRFQGYDNTMLEISVAGLIAERAAFGRWRWRNAYDDLNQAVDELMLWPGPDGRARSEELCRIVGNSVDYVLAWQAAIETVADLLQERRTLTYEDVLAVCQQDATPSDPWRWTPRITWWLQFVLGLHLIDAERERAAA